MPNPLPNDVQDLFAAMRESIKHAVPYKTTFLFLEEDCSAIGQETALSKAVEKAMKKDFEIWVSTWITPRLDDLEKSLMESSAEQTTLFTNWLKAQSDRAAVRK